MLHAKQQRIKSCHISRWQMGTEPRSKPRLIWASLIAKGAHQAPGIGTIAFLGEKKNSLIMCYLYHINKTYTHVHPHTHELHSCEQNTNCTHFRNHCGINFINSGVFFFLNKSRHTRHRDESLFIYLKVSSTTTCSQNDVPHETCVQCWECPGL